MTNETTVIPFEVQQGKVTAIKVGDKLFRLRKPSPIETFDGIAEAVRSVFDILDFSPATEAISQDPLAMIEWPSAVRKRMADHFFKNAGRGYTPVEKEKLLDLITDAPQSFRWLATKSSKFMSDHKTRLLIEVLRDEGLVNVKKVGRQYLITRKH